MYKYEKKQETYGQRTTAWCLWPKQKAIIKGKRENRDVGYGLEGDNDHHIMPIMSFGGIYGVSRRRFFQGIE